jgi:hypothetical protein
MPLAAGDSVVRDHPIRQGMVLRIACDSACGGAGQAAAWLVAQVPVPDGVPAPPARGVVATGSRGPVRGADLAAAAAPGRRQEATVKPVRPRWPALPGTGCPPSALPMPGTRWIAYFMRAGRCKHTHLLHREPFQMVAAIQQPGHCLWRV